MDSKSSTVVAKALGLFLCSSFPRVFSTPQHAFPQRSQAVGGYNFPGHYSVVPFPQHHHREYPLGVYSQQVDNQHAKPSFTYEYGVADEFTGDMKTAYEKRDGDFVQGGYQVLQPDGILRVVTYTVDPLHGFQTKIQMLNGLARHPLPASAPAVGNPHGSTNRVPVYYPQAFPVMDHPLGPPGPTLYRKPITKRRELYGKRTRRFATTLPEYHQRLKFPPF